MASYLRNEAGRDHELVVIWKGFGSAEGADRAREIFSGISYRSLWLDDSGVDITAYLTAAAQLEHEYICFLNTFSRISAKKWLSHLVSPLEGPEAGIVGATGSYQSLHDSLAVIGKAIWLCQRRKIRFSPRFRRHFGLVLLQKRPI